MVRANDAAARQSGDDGIDRGCNAASADNPAGSAANMTVTPLSFLAKHHHIGISPPPAMRMGQ